MRDIGLDLLSELRAHRQRRGITSERGVGGAVQQHRRSRPGNGHPAWPIGRLAFIQHRAADPGNGGKPVTGLSRRGPRGTHLPKVSAPRSTSATLSIQPAPSFAVSARARGPDAAMNSGIGILGC